MSFYLDKKLYLDKKNSKILGEKNPHFERMDFFSLCLGISFVEFFFAVRCCRWNMQVEHSPKNTSSGLYKVCDVKKNRLLQLSLYPQMGHWFFFQPRHVNRLLFNNHFSNDISFFVLLYIFIVTTHKQTSNVFRTSRCGCKTKYLFKDSFFSPASAEPNTLSNNLRFEFGFVIEKQLIFLGYLQTLSVFKNGQWFIWATFLVRSVL